MNVQSIPIDRVDLDALDAFLESDRAPEDSMQLSDLDGFLTGIAVGPELIMPSEWLPVIWGGEEGPSFADEAEAASILGAIMGRYNQILRSIEQDALKPIFWATSEGTVIAADWAEGFMMAVGLRMEAWKKLFLSKREAHLLFPFLALCGDENGESMLGLSGEDEDRAMDLSAEVLPECVLGIAAYWRNTESKRTGLPSVRATAPKVSATPKPGRNDPCPCGSGKKFKKCCG